MEKLKVVKFGGTSMASVKTINKVVKIIKENKARKIIVVSAPGKRFKKDRKVTDLLYERKIDEVEKRFKDFANLTSEFDTIKEKIKKGCSEAYLVSRGEYLSAKVLADKLDFEFVDADELFKFKNNVFDAKGTKERIKERLKNVKKAVIPGFYGADEEGNVITFPRGGSDFSGAVIAGALGADYENWTDVDGVFMCNPKIVKKPKKLNVMTYGELRELSYMGANVLQEDCVFPIREAGAKIHILNTFNKDGKGTIVTSKKRIDKKVTGISGLKDLVKITVHKKRQFNKRYMIRQTLRIFEEQKILLEFALVDIDTCSFIVRPFEKIEELKAELINKRWCEKIEVEKDIAAIVIIGGGFDKCPNIFERIFGVLCENKVKLKFVNFNEGSNVFIGVSNKNFEKTIRKLYNCFKDE